MSDESRPHHAAAVGVGVLEFGGRTFLLPPVGGPDQMAIYSEFRRQCLADARDPLAVVNERVSQAEKAGRPFSATVIDAMVKSAMSAATRSEGKAEPSDAEIAARINTLDGSRFVVWYRLRRADPTVTREWVAEHVPDMDARNAVFARLAEVDGLAALDPKKV